jgi:hypothetical protein
MRASIAFFAGVGTVVVAVAAGLGGGLLIADIMNPQASRQESGQDMTRVDRRASPEQKDVARSTTAANDHLTPVPYLAAIQPAANAPVVVAPAPQNSPQAASPRSGAGASERQAEQSAVVTAANDQARGPSDAPTSKPAQAAQPATREQATTADDANAKDTNAKPRYADQKRLAEKRKAERRQQWADRQRYQQREDELRGVEQKVREDSERREEYVERQDDADQPVRMEFPRPLFGPD